MARRVIAAVALACALAGAVGVAGWLVTGASAATVESHPPEQAQPPTARHAAVGLLRGAPPGDGWTLDTSDDGCWCWYSPWVTFGGDMTAVQRPPNDGENAQNMFQLVVVVRGSNADCWTWDSDPGSHDCTNAPLGQGPYEARFISFRGPSDPLAATCETPTECAGDGPPYSVASLGNPGWGNDEQPEPTPTPTPTVTETVTETATATVTAQPSPTVGVEGSQYGSSGFVVDPATGEVGVNEGGFIGLGGAVFLLMVVAGAATTWLVMP